MNFDSLIITGPIGSDKSIVVNEIIKEFPNTFYYSVSHTTRPIYPGEELGLDYYFISNKEFETMIQNNEFIEFIKVDNYYYGTSKQELQKAKIQNKICLFDLDINGAKAIKSIPNYKSISIYIVPFNLTNLERRMKSRGDSINDINKRLNKARKDIHNINISLYDKTISIRNLEESLLSINKYIFKKIDNNSVKILN